MATELDLKNLDRRIVDRMIKRGELTEKDLDKAVKQLPDRAEESDTVVVKFERTSGNGGGEQ